MNGYFSQSLRQAQIIILEILRCIPAVIIFAFLDLGKKFSFSDSLLRKTLLLMILGVAFMFTGKVYAEQKVSVNTMGITHKGSGGISIAFPDVCKTPSPGGPVPIPYPDIGKSSDTSKGTKKVKMTGKPIMPKDSNLNMGIGDETGIRGGGKQKYHKVKSHPKAKPNTTVNYPRPAYYKYLTPSDN